MYILFRVHYFRKLLFLLNANDKNIYIQSAKLNGQELNRCWFRHTDISDGGSLEFIMGNKPSKWGQSGELPPSMSFKNK